MAKRQHTFTVNPGTYAGLRARAKLPFRSNPQPLGQTSSAPKVSPVSSVSLVSLTPVINEWEQFTKRTSHCVWAMYCAMSSNYIAIITILVVILLTFLLPDISQKIQATNELKSMKQILNKMSNDVKQAEVACLTVADEICCLHCSMHDDTTETSKEKLPDLSICTSHCMRTTQSEPIPVEKKIGFFRRIFFPSPSRNVSQHKEVTIMSYVYTDSFDAKRTIEPQQQVISVQV